MNDRAAVAKHALSAPPRSGGVLRRQCACGQRTHAGEECEECRRKRQQGRLQRAATWAAPCGTAPPIVHETLAAPGLPLEPAVREPMEAAFGADFSRVRVHLDGRAARSARAVHALAYTVGREVVFGAGQYRPQTESGRELLAHELTHVVQQGGVSPARGSEIAIGPEHDEAERAAASNASALASGAGGGPSPGFSAAPSSAVLRREPGPGDPEPAEAAGEEAEGHPTPEGLLGFGDRPAEPGCPRPPTYLGRREPDPPCPTPAEEEEIEGEPFHFCLDSDVFLDPATPAAIAVFARRQPSRASFTVHGYASSEGRSDYNLNLSCHRAKRVARELINAGVPSERIEIVAKGETTRFSPVERNRVALVRAQAPGRRPRTGPLPSDPNELVQLARSRLESGDYRLAADAYLSFWSCGRVPTISRAVRLSTIRIAGQEGVPYGASRLGYDASKGLNVIVLTPEMFRTADPLECITARILDLAVHHALRPHLPQAQLHPAGQFAVELAGLLPCREPDTELLPGVVERGGFWWPRPTADPRQGEPKPACVDVLPGAITPQRQPRAGHDIPSFRTESFSLVGGSGSILWQVRRGGARMATPRGAFHGDAKVSVSGGDPAEYGEYEVGFLQTITEANTTMEYVSGHRVQETLPVPIRDGPPRRYDVPPWFYPPLVGRPAMPSAEAETTTTDSPSQSMPYEYLDFEESRFFRRTVTRRGRQVTLPPRPVVQSGNVLHRAKRHVVFKTWLAARRRDAPLDRFSTHFLEGRTVDFRQNVDVVGRTGTGTYTAKVGPSAAGDVSLMQLDGPVPGDLAPTQILSFSPPVERASAGGLTLRQFTDRVRSIADPHRRRLGGLSGRLTIRVRIEPSTGRLALDTSGRKTVTVEGQGAAQDQLDRLAQAILEEARKELILAPIEGRYRELTRIPVVMRPL